ncbi:Motile sperm domain-containing protein 2-like protein [Dinothrombium tinctorium]|uniref:Motile sperm domain-containing protein 2-like protein n=1 Tax=Dinothrombium tinctorium TaxID=1965070 RepID=A0A3S3NM41_9ACAR|nr:Motile sperm domain-containing protein 2-like protein [Dinothrombium tinctorium]RWS02160.1 Motile sperm domain-containing protein 2-like protein [Dinothrombium tinctorium]
MEANIDKLNAIREELLKVFEGDPRLFDANDVNKIVMNDNYLNRFLQRQRGDLKKAIDFVKQTLIWRKQEGLTKMNDSFIPRELYEIGGSLIYGTDVEGNAVMYMRAKYSKMPKEIRGAMERMMYFYVYKVLEKGLFEENDKGWTLVLDLSGISVCHCDPQAVFSALKMLHHMPSGIKRILIFDFPYFAKPLFKFALSLTPTEWRNLIQFVNLKQLQKLISPEKLPSFFENPQSKFESEIPADAKYIDEIDLTEIGLNSENKKIFKNYIEKIRNI